MANSAATQGDPLTGNLDYVRLLAQLRQTRPIPRRARDVAEGPREPRRYCGQSDAIQHSAGTLGLPRRRLTIRLVRRAALCRVNYHTPCPSRVEDGRAAFRRGNEGESPASYALLVSLVASEEVIQPPTRQECHRALRTPQTQSRSYF
jgi:hypothetical protein